MEQNDLRPFIQQDDLPDSKKRITGLEDLLDLPRSREPKALLFNPTELETPKLDPQTEAWMRSRLEGNTSVSFLPQFETQLESTVHAQDAEPFAVFMEFKHRIKDDLKSSFYHCYKNLNVSRKKQIHERLAGSLPKFNQNPTACFEKWLETHAPDEVERVLSPFFDDIATVCLAQIALFKRWADLEIRALKEEDLSNLNWSLSRFLQPFASIEREPWQVTRQNLFSWYSPNGAVKGMIWEKLRQLPKLSAHPSALYRILFDGRAAIPAYDLRFYSLFWKAAPIFGFDPAALRKKRPYQKSVLAFTPSIGDGLAPLFADFPADFPLEAVGLEQDPLLLILSEILQLWNGPRTPLLWAHHTGQNIKPQTQLRMDAVMPMMGAQKSNVGNLGTLEQLENCDLGYFIETTKNKTGPARALMAATKLRPGGLLFWSREQKLAATEDAESIRGIFERCTLKAEIDLGSIQYSLPGQKRVFPKFFYVFERTNDVPSLHHHHPLMVHVSGSLRSHIEVPLLLEDSFLSCNQETTARGNWSIHRRPSPIPQLEWLEHWPSPTNESFLSKVSWLKSRSTPLGQLGLVQPYQASHDAPTLGIGIAEQEAIWISRKDPPFASRISLPQGLSSLSSHSGLTGFFVLNLPLGWAAPITGYLNSDFVSEWLKTFCETKKGHYLLKESILKILPVPSSLVDCMKQLDPRTLTASMKDRLLTEEPRTAADAAKRFVAAAQESCQTNELLHRLKDLIQEDGTPRWCEIIKTLPQSEIIKFSLHSEILIKGSLPPHKPIERFHRTSPTSRGQFNLASTDGSLLMITAENPILADILWAQFQSIEKSLPTWGELVQYVFLPRKSDWIFSTFQDLMNHKNQYRNRAENLQKVMNACLNFGQL